MSSGAGFREFLAPFTAFKEFLAPFTAFKEFLAPFTCGITIYEWLKNNCIALWKTDVLTPWRHSIVSSMYIFFTQSTKYREALQRYSNKCDFWEILAVVPQPSQDALATRAGRISQKECLLLNLLWRITKELTFEKFYRSLCSCCRTLWQWSCQIEIVCVCVCVCVCVSVCVCVRECVSVAAEL